MQSGYNRPKPIKNLKETSTHDDKKFRIRRKNASILIKESIEDIHKKTPLPN